MIKKKSPVKTFLKIAAVVIAVIFVFAIISSMTHDSDDMQGSTLNEEAISKVRDFSPAGADGITYGEAYADFYGDPEWSQFMSEDNESVVEFAGECTYKDKEGNAYLQFTLDDEGNIDSYYGQFKYKGKKKKVDIDSDILKDLFFQPIVDYAKDTKGKELTDDQVTELYSNITTE